MKADPVDPVAPKAVGVIVIGRNEGERLRRCLTSAVREAARLLYVDSDSSDGSVALAQSLGVETHVLAGAAPLSAARARNEGRERLRQMQPALTPRFWAGSAESCESLQDAPPVPLRR